MQVDAKKPRAPSIAASLGKGVLERYPALPWPGILQDLLECLGYFSGADAAGADLDGGDRTVSQCFDLLEVRVPDSGSFVIGMAHVVAKAGAFSTYRAYF